MATHKHWSGALIHTDEYKQAVEFARPINNKVMARAKWYKGNEQDLGHQSYQETKAYHRVGHFKQPSIDDKRFERQVRWETELI